MPALIRRRARGFTLVELMLGLAAMSIGLLGVMHVLGAVMRGSSAANRHTQGQARAQQIMEAVLAQSPAVLDCLAGSDVTAWATCEAACRAELGPASSPRACVFVSLAAVGQEADGTRQRYAVVSDPADPDRSTWVRRAPGSARLREFAVTIGWSDEGDAAPRHRVTLRSKVYR